MADTGFFGYKIGAIHTDKALLTDLYVLPSDLPETVPVELWPLAVAGFMINLADQPDFCCPARGLAHSYDKEFHKAAKDVRELALKYSA